MTLVIVMNLFNIVLKAKLMLGASAGAMYTKTLIMNGDPKYSAFSLLSNPRLLVYTQVLVSEAV